MIDLIRGLLLIAIGAVLGWGAAVTYGLAHLVARDGLLSFMSNIAGATLGSGLAVILALWVARIDRREARAQAIEANLAPIQRLRDIAAHLLDDDVRGLTPDYEELKMANMALHRVVNQYETGDAALRRVARYCLEVSKDRVLAIGHSLHPQSPQPDKAEKLLGEIVQAFDLQIKNYVRRQQ